MIKDLMHSGASLPLLSENASMKDILATMSRGDVRGAAGILGAGGELVGIITDGDIRRILETTSDPFQGVARDFMGRNPRTIDASELAEKALFMMEQFRIQVLFVLDRESATPKSPVGIIHIQDLLKAKVR
jgi:arabinose-5-phosphate isomerase